MTRSAARELAVRYAYEISYFDGNAEEFLKSRLSGEYFTSLNAEDPIYSEPPDVKQLGYIERLVKGVMEHSAELDSYIEKYAIGWSFDRISRMAVAVMRVAMFEVLYMPDIPNGAAINEAVEIARRYEDADAVSFINGVLGSFTRKEASH